MKSEQGNGITETGTRQQGHQHIVQEKDYRDGEVQRQNQVQQQHTNQQQEIKKGLQTHHEQAVIDQEEQWQVQKRKQTKNQEQTLPKTAWRPVSPQYKATKNNMQQAPSTAGILSNIPIHNNYIDLVMQEQPNKGIAGDNTNKGKSDHEVQTIEGSRDDESNHTTTNVLKDHVTDNCYNKTSGIDLSLPLPHSPNGGMDGGCQEKTTNLQEGATKGGNLTHVLFEGAHNDLNSDLRASATTTQNYAKTVHQVQEIQKAALAQDTGQGGHNQVDSTVDQVRAPKEYKQQKGQGAGTETNIQTQKKKGTTGIEGT
uniref:Bifunctional endo-1,4-beta-xylanase xylA n=1 Tax=Solanum tuberosum TaxID=4113 RepID=M1DAW7_SOLTU